MFSSRQFSAANAVTFVVYAALSGVFFLLVAFLQISLGYSPIAAGAGNRSDAFALRSLGRACTAHRSARAAPASVATSERLGPR